MAELNDNQGIPLRDLPNELLQRNSSQLHNYSTVLIRVNSEDSEPHVQIGSGTYVSVDGNVFGILTAYHVAKELRGEDLGIFIQPEDVVQRPVIPNEVLVIHNIAIPETDQEGPDLAFIQLPQNQVSTIRAYKSFFPIDMHAERMLTSPPDSSESIWFICGIPEEKTKIEHSGNDGHEELLNFASICGATGPEKIFSKGGYDYIKTMVEYTDTNQDVPKSFSGYSGGGLWQARGWSEGDDCISKEFLLSGVVYYQSALENNRRMIRSHGIESVYKKCLDYIRLHVE